MSGQPQATDSSNSCIPEVSPISSSKPSSCSDADTTPEKPSPTAKPRKTPSETPQPNPVVEVEVALSIAVNIPAPDGYEDMEENEIMAATLERLQDSTEYIDAYSNLHNIVKFHRDTYPNAKASFTPVMGLIDGEEI